MDITAQTTPNPNALKFVLPNKFFDRPLSFPSEEKARTHPLAAELFALGYVYNVFMVQDFVTVNKLPHVQWDAIQDQIEAIIVRYIC